MEGWLLKKASGPLGRWQPRYFKLKTKGFSYQKGSGDAVVSVPLSEIDSVTLTEGGFSVAYGSGKVSQLRTEGEGPLARAKVKDWLQAFYSYGVKTLNYQPRNAQRPAGSECREGWGGGKKERKRQRAKGPVVVKESASAAKVPAQDNQPDGTKSTSGDGMPSKLAQQLKEWADIDEKRVIATFKPQMSVGLDYENQEILQVWKGTQAFYAGVRPGMVITHVNGNRAPTNDDRLQDLLVSLVRGQKLFRMTFTRKEALREMLEQERRAAIAAVQAETGASVSDAVGEAAGKADAGEEVDVDEDDAIAEIDLDLTATSIEPSPRAENNGAVSIAVSPVALKESLQFRRRAAEENVEEVNDADLEMILGALAVGTGTEDDLDLAFTSDDDDDGEGGGGSPEIKQVEATPTKGGAGEDSLGIDDILVGEELAGDDKEEQVLGDGAGDAPKSTDGKEPTNVDTSLPSDENADDGRAGVAPNEQVEETPETAAGGEEGKTAAEASNGSQSSQSSDVAPANKLTADGDTKHVADPLLASPELAVEQDPSDAANQAPVDAANQEPVDVPESAKPKNESEDIAIESKSKTEAGETSDPAQTSENEREAKTTNAVEISNEDDAQAEADDAGQGDAEVKTADGKADDTAQVDTESRVVEQAVEKANESKSKTEAGETSDPAQTSENEREAKTTNAVEISNEDDAQAEADDAGQGDAEVKTADGKADDTAQVDTESRVVEQAVERANEEAEQQRPDSKSGGDETGKSGVALQENPNTAATGPASEVSKENVEESICEEGKESTNDEVKEKLKESAGKEGSAKTDDAPEATVGQLNDVDADSGQGSDKGGTTANLPDSDKAETQSEVAALEAELAEKTIQAKKLKAKYAILSKKTQVAFAKLKKLAEVLSKKKKTSKAKLIAQRNKTLAALVKSYKTLKGKMDLVKAKARAKKKAAAHKQHV